MPNEKGRKTKCNKCEYEWICRSEMYLVSCPRCGYKQRINNP